MKPIHPFPARMAPDLVLDHLKQLDKKSQVLDPMVGSGVVLRQALAAGHEAIGFDMDPLAVLMTRVWTTPIADDQVEKWANRLIKEAQAVEPSLVKLHWIDDDPETTAFLKFWFAETQRNDLRRIAFVLDKYMSGRAAVGRTILDILRLALSRIIVTKEPCASLARDTSHSRPHKVCKESDFEVFPAYQKAIRFLRKRLRDNPPRAAATVTRGDVRRLVTIKDGTIDAVLTSPPYLNAIDYLRAHRMALVWLGYQLTELRDIRSNSIGAERAPGNLGANKLIEKIGDAMGSFDQLPRRYRSMIERYAGDLFQMMSEIVRVLRPGGMATFVIGNSCLKGTFVRNSDGLAEAAIMMGLTPTTSTERLLPERRRYLPITTGGQLSKRMRTETVCSFKKPLLKRFNPA